MGVGMTRMTTDDDDDDDDFSLFLLPSYVLQARRGDNNTERR